MGDRCFVALKFGGPVTLREAISIAKEIHEEGPAGFDTDEGYRALLAHMADAAAVGSEAMFEFEEANYGEIEGVVNALDAAKGIQWTKYNGKGDGFDAAMQWHNFPDDADVYGTGRFFECTETEEGSMLSEQQVRWMLNQKSPKKQLEIWHEKVGRLPPALTLVGHERIFAKYIGTKALLGEKAA